MEGYSQRKKKQKRKENRPDGKVENAMKPRFPLSHRAYHEKPKDDHRREPKSQRRRSIDRNHKEARYARINHQPRGGIFT